MAAALGGSVQGAPACGAGSVLRVVPGIPRLAPPWGAALCLWEGPFRYFSKF